MSVGAMCHRIGEWVVLSSGPKGFSRFPQEAWSKLPRELSWMRTLYAEQYLARELCLEPSVMVDVQGMAFVLSLRHALGKQAPR